MDTVILTGFYLFSIQIRSYSNVAARFIKLHKGVV